MDNYDYHHILPYPSIFSKFALSLEDTAGSSLLSSCLLLTFEVQEKNFPTSWGKTEETENCFIFETFSTHKLHWDRYALRACPLLSILQSRSNFCAQKVGIVPGNESKSIIK